VTTAPTGRTRAAKRSGSNKTSTRGATARTGTSTSVVDLVDEGSAIETDDVIDLSPARPTRTTPSVPEPDPRLLALGLPAELTPATATADLRAALEQRLSQLPPLPAVPRTRGVVIAIVGVGADSDAPAQRLGDELRVGRDRVLLQTPEAMSALAQPGDADAFRRSCRRRSGPTIVSCSIGSGRAQLQWARRILGRIEPTITWAVVDASVKVEDVAHRVETLGGVDAIALTGVADTVSPAAILALGIPVGRIGAHAATPALWTDVLMERLER